MKKFFNSLFGILTVLTGIIGMYAFVWKHDLGLALAAFFECAFLFVLFVMSKSRPRNTEAQIKHDNRIQKQGAGTLLLIVFAIGIIVIASSCSANKYGCGRGNPKMTWNKMVRSINRP